MDAWLSTLLLASACALWIVHIERRREQRRLAALAIAERVMRRRGQVRELENLTLNLDFDLEHST